MRISDWSSDVCSSDLAGFHWQGRPESRQCLYTVSARARWQGAVHRRRSAPARWRPASGTTSHGRPPWLAMRLLYPGVRHVHVGHVQQSDGCAACAHRHTRRLVGQSVSLYRSEEHTSELQSLMRISYAVFCLKKKKILITDHI